MFVKPGPLVTMASVNGANEYSELLSKQTLRKWNIEITLCSLTRFDSIWLDLTRFDSIWLDLTRFDSIWLGSPQHQTCPWTWRRLQLNGHCTFATTFAIRMFKTMSRIVQILTWGLATGKDYHCLEQLSGKLFVRWCDPFDVLAMKSINERQNCTSSVPMWLPCDPWMLNSGTSRTLPSEK